MNLDHCYHGSALDVLRTLPDECVQTCVTSPPYWGLRDYGTDGQLGLEKTPEEYVARMVDVFAEVRRVLRDDGTLWLNLGDSYAGGGGFSPDAPCNQARANGESWGALNPANMSRHEAKEKPAHARKAPAGLKPKDLVGIPWRVAFALQADGWYLRQDIIWHKPNPMPESVRDRCTKAHEYVFLLSKSARYFYDAAAIAEKGTGVACGNTRPTKAARNGDDMQRTAGNLHKIEAAESRNRRSVWTVATAPYPGAHFATFPPALIEPCIMAGAASGGVVLDPFMGSGTTAQVAQNLGRRWIGIEISEEYLALQHARTSQQALAL